MDLYHLKTFFNLGKVGSFTETARVMYVTQSAVSHAIKKLERSVGTKLIERKGKSFSLTHAGQKLFESCEKIFYELESTQDEITLMSEERVLNILLGSPVEFGTTILLKHIKEFIIENPHIHVDFYFSNNLLAPFREDGIDLMVDCADHDLKDTEKIFLFRELYTVIATPEFMNEHELSEIADLADVPILSRDKGGEWWQNFTRAVPGGDVKLGDNIIGINHVRGIINGAINNLGVGFVPRYTVINELADGTLVDPFPSVRPLADNFHIYVKKKKNKIEKINKIIQYLTSIQPAEFGSSSQEGG